MDKEANFLFDTIIKEARNQIEIDTKQFEVVDDFPQLLLGRKTKYGLNEEFNEKFAEFDLNDNYINRMRDTYDNRAFRHIYSCRKIIGPAIVFFKRVVRKLLKWYIEPVCDQQSDFNGAVLSSIEQIYVGVNNLAQCNLSEWEIFKHNIEEQLSIMIQNFKVQINKANVAHQDMQAQMNRVDIMQRDLDKKSDQICQLQYNLQEEFKQQLSITVQNFKVQINKINVAHQDMQAQMDRVDIMQRDLDKKSDQMCQLQYNLQEEFEQRIMQVESKLRNEFEEKLVQFSPKYEFGQISSSSQSGEDTIVAYVLDKLGIPFSECTYLELGANHPKAMSNTYLLYRFGARGVLVEANPCIISELENERRGDIILNRCVTKKTGDYIDFYILNGDGLSSSDYEYVQECISKNSSLKVEKKVRVETISTSEILRKYFFEPPMLVSIDIEGMELSALQDMNLKYCRPLFIIVEMISYSPQFVRSVKNVEILKYMESMGYMEYAFTGINSIFVPREKWENSYSATVI